MYKYIIAMWFLCFFNGGLHSDSKDLPNILLIVSDDQGYSDLGFLNSEVKTPYLNDIAQRGIHLKNFYVTWPACTPSRGSFLTGRYPQRNGTYDMFRNEAPDFGYRYQSRDEYEISWEFIGGMDEREVLIPEFLKKSNYRNGIFGKWDLGSLKRYLPLQRGFDDFYGFVNSSVDYYTHERYGVHAMYRNNQQSYEDQGQYTTDLFEREALRFIDQNHKQPFFLFLPFNAPHNASNLELKIRSAPQAKEEDFKHFSELLKKTDTKIKFNKRYKKEYESPNDEMKRLLYLASIYRMDQAIGSVLKRLEKYQIRDNTFILFFSDNGGGSGSNNLPLKGKKGKMFEGGVRVPALVSYPKVLPQGTSSNEFLSSLEVLPTLLSLAKVKNKENVILDGFNMLPVLKGEKPSPRDRIFWKRRQTKAMRFQNYKYIEDGSKVYLYNLEKDISEKNNLIFQEPEALKSCQIFLQQWIQEMNEAEPRGPFKNY